MIGRRGFFGTVLAVLVAPFRPKVAPKKNLGISIRMMREFDSFERSE
jgi:hypothetical protein